METRKGEEAEEGKVTDMVETVVKVLPDVAEITINTMINPASGLLTLVQKVAKRVEGRQEATPEPQTGSTETEDAQAQAAATPVEISAETAAEALDEVHEQLEQMPDSPEKELVEQTLQQLEEADKNGVEKLVDGVAEVLPDVAEASVKTARKVVESVAEGQQE